MGSLKRKIKKIFKEPLLIFDVKMWRKAANVIKGGELTDVNSSKRIIKNEHDNAYVKRKYVNYNEYVNHQKSKLDVKGVSYLKEYDILYSHALSERLSDLINDGILSLEGKNALCLAARIGSECKAFIEHGTFAVGIDLNPGKDNKYVVSGDFHHIQFSDNSIDVVFTNSLDHVYDFTKVMDEVGRVLKKDGLFIAEFGIEEGNKKIGSYESFGWESLDKIKALVVKNGYKQKYEKTFEIPWKGSEVIFEKVSKT